MPYRKSADKLINLVVFTFCRDGKRQTESVALADNRFSLRPDRRKPV